MMSANWLVLWILAWDLVFDVEAGVGGATRE